MAMVSTPSSSHWPTISAAGTERAPDVSLERDRTISAEHRRGGYVHQTCGTDDRPPSEEWHFETTTVHAAGEEMRNRSTRPPGPPARTRFPRACPVYPVTVRWSGRWSLPQRSWD